MQHEFAEYPEKMKRKNYKHVHRYWTAPPEQLRKVQQKAKYVHPTCLPFFVQYQQASTISLDEIYCLI